MGRLVGAADSQVVIFNQTAPRLLAALSEGNLPDALHYWSILQQENLIGYLGPAHFEPLSRSLANLLSVPGQERAWADTVLEPVQTMALTAAPYHTDGLLACMLYYVRSKDGPAALALYHRYLDTSSAAAWAGTSEQETEPQEQDELASMRESRSMSSTGGIDLRMAAIAAYALNDGFYEGMAMSLQSPVRLPRITYAESFVKTHLGHDPAFAEKVEAYVRTFERARLVSRPGLLSKHIENISADNNVAALEKLYTSIDEAFEDPYAWLTTNPGEVSSKRPVLLTESIWASFIFTFVHCGRPGLVEKVWDDMYKRGAVPGAASWTALIDGYGTLGQVDKSNSYFEAMIAQGVVPTASTYRALIHALFRAQAQEDAMRRFAEFREKASSFPEDEQVAVFNVALNGLLSWKPRVQNDVVKERDTRAAEARALFESMRLSGPKPDIITYNTMLAYYGKRRDMASSAEILELLTADGATGDVFTFSIILTAMLNVGRQDAQEIMLNVMRKHGVRPNVATFTGIMTHQIRHGSVENVKESLRMLQRMEVDPDKHMHPNQFTYTSIIAAISRHPELNPELIDEYTQSILKRMAVQGIRPNRTTYHHLIAASLENPSPMGAHRALGFYQEMVHQRMVLIYNTWYILLNGLFKRKDWAIGKVIAGDMLRSGFRPTGTLQEIVGRIMQH
jgi:pentatricopeptide repeat protein